MPSRHVDDCRSAFAKTAAAVRVQLRKVPHPSTSNLSNCSRISCSRSSSRDRVLAQASLLPHETSFAAAAADAWQRPWRRHGRLIAGLA